MDKWIPVLWIFAVGVGFFVLLLVVDLLKGRGKKGF